MEFNIYDGWASFEVTRLDAAFNRPRQQPSIFWMILP